MKKNNYFKRIYSLIVLSILGYSLSFAQTFPIEFEAEDADFIHYMNIRDEANYSGGKRLEGQDAKSSYVQYNINGIEEAGTYDVTVIYGSGADRYFYSKVNNQPPVVVLTPDAGAWERPDGSVTYQVYFDAGNNVLEIGAYTKDGIHLNNLDKFSIDKSEEKIKRLADGFTYSREAEDFDDNNRFHADDSRVLLSGGAGLGGEGEDGNDAWAKYNISDIPEAGVYDILIYYVSMDENRKFYVKSNDDALTVFRTEERTNNWGTDREEDGNPAVYRIRTQINLVAGDNVIELGHRKTDSDFPPNLDKFEIIKIGVNEEDLGGDEPGDEPGDEEGMIEAENADVRHYMNIVDGSSFSGGKRLEGQDAKSSYARYNIDGIEEAGTYDVTVYYASAQDRHFYSKVNNQFPIAVATPDMGSWDEPTGEVTYQVYFDAGNNVLEIGAYDNGDNYHLANIDRLLIVKSEEEIERPTDIFMITQEAEEGYTDKGSDWNTADDLNALSGGNGLKGDGENSWAKYTINNIPEDGEYDILVYYASMDRDRKFYVKVNDGERVIVNVLEESSTWGDNPEVNPNTPVTCRTRKHINLNKGTNVIEIGADFSTSPHSPNFDKFEIVKFGAFEEDPGDGTAIETKGTDNLNVYASSNKIFINNTNADYAIFNVLGRQLVSGQCTGSVEIDMPTGIYIVKVNNSAVKVLVK